MGLYDVFHLVEGLKCPNCRKGPDYFVGSNQTAGTCPSMEGLQIICLHDGKAGIKTLQTKDLENLLEDFYFPDFLPVEFVENCDKSESELMKHGIDVYDFCKNCNTNFNGKILLQALKGDVKGYFTKELVVEAFCEEDTTPYADELKESTAYDIILEQSLLETDEAGRRKVTINVKPLFSKCREEYLKETHKAVSRIVELKEFFALLSSIARSSGEPYIKYASRVPQFPETPALQETTHPLQTLHNALAYRNALEDLSDDLGYAAIALAFAIEKAHKERVHTIITEAGLSERFALEYRILNAPESSFLASIGVISGPRAWLNRMRDS